MHQGAGFGAMSETLLSSAYWRKFGAGPDWLGHRRAGLSEDAEISDRDDAMASATPSSTPYRKQGMSIPAWREASYACAAKRKHCA